MTKPLTVVLELLALVFLLMAYAQDRPGLYVIAAICGIAGIVGTRKRKSS
jgi:hypothetical protein